MPVNHRRTVLHLEKPKSSSISHWFSTEYSLTPSRDQPKEL
jgi:hypothetical protein